MFINTEDNFPWQNKHFQRQLNFAEISKIIFHVKKKFSSNEKLFFLTMEINFYHRKKFSSDRKSLLPAKIVFLVKKKFSSNEKPFFNNENNAHHRKKFSSDRKSLLTPKIIFPVKKKFSNNKYNFQKCRKYFPLREKALQQRITV